MAGGMQQLGQQRSPAVFIDDDATVHWAITKLTACNSTLQVTTFFQQFGRDGGNALTECSCLNTGSSSGLTRLQGAGEVKWCEKEA